MTTVNAPTKPTTKENPMATVSKPTKPAQIRVARRSQAYWRVTIDNPPINVMGPEMVAQFQEVINALEADEHVRVVVFDSAVDDYFLNHSDFLAKLEDLTSLPAGPTGLPPWPDFLVRLTRIPVASIALIRGRATGNGSEITLACDMSFASREKAILSQWEVGVGMVAGGGPMARLPQLIGRNRALEMLLSSEDIRGEAGRSIWLRESCTSGRRFRRVRRNARDTDRQVRQMGDRQYQTSRQYQPAAGRRAWRRVGCLHCFARPARRAEWDQSPDDARLPQAGGCRKSPRILPGPNRALAGGWRRHFFESLSSFFTFSERRSLYVSEQQRSKACSAKRSPASPTGQEVFKTVLSEDVDWKPFPAFPPSVRLAVVVGRPSEPGPYTIRVKMPHGEKLMPHRHPEDRVYTVISGVFYIGLGDQFDGSKLEAYPPGAVIILPGNTPHFHWAKSGEYVTQVTAMGPLGLEYLSVKDDPRNSPLLGES